MTRIASDSAILDGQSTRITDATATCACVICNSGVLYNEYASSIIDPAGAAINWMSYIIGDGTGLYS
jgi:hypothetical protein